MKETLKISVIIPVYNSQEFIWDAIESILSQSFQDFECIIIDDASTDGSYKICEEYASQDNRIRLYKNKTNKWISYTRNKLIGLAQTDYIASQDSDDISLSSRLQLSYDFLESHTDYAVVSWNNLIIDDQGFLIGKRMYNDSIQSTILKKNPISQPASMFRKDVFFEAWGYDLDLNLGEDYDLWLKIYAKWYKIKNLNQNLISYRIHGLQSKVQQLKETISSTIYIQTRAIKEYGLPVKISDKIYILFEKILLLLPVRFILFLFQALEYKKIKS